MENFQRRFLLALLGYAVQREVDGKRLCELSGIDLRELQQNQAIRYDAPVINSLWKNAMHLTNDPLFGLHFGESMQLAALGIIGQIVQTSNTVEDAINNAGAMTPLITDIFQMKLERGKSYFSLHFLYDPQKAAAFPFSFRGMADYLTVIVVHELDGLLLQRIAPVSVHLPYSTAGIPEYERILRCPVRKSKSEISVELHNRYLTEPILTANYAMQQHLLQQISVTIRGTDSDSSLHTRIYNYLLTNSYLQLVSQDSVAANFNISTRSLQRKLKEEGITYLEIVEEVRKTLAISYLSDHQYQIKEVAHILGYNELSAFTRAFKRWTGINPAEYGKRKK
ncbi:AraC family transcriptional regulator [Pseudoflavitalea sp. G-6-1-2]|uniref:AraC family transcriptional regulator n=1 Tax=Pseudoflavitalea sp. G-6-1-2 TaxID=2728841 RepID=UPI00146BB7A1|nr:AraC family transcriptional regulator [Pseudoflavitalea sp. G-6-1-2]NML22935.1 AraC family transcriptional regulator [Pseudoflavitalea sp. G-6-1-2]